MIRSARQSQAKSRLTVAQNLHETQNTQRRVQPMAAKPTTQDRRASCLVGFTRPTSARRTEHGAPPPRGVGRRISLDPLFAARTVSGHKMTPCRIHRHTTKQINNKRQRSKRLTIGAAPVPRRTFMDVWTAPSAGDDSRGLVKR